MAKQPSSKSPSITNRSPWLVEVRGNADLSKRFALNNKKLAKAYLASLTEQGIQAKLIQLEESFQLRMRRQGTKDKPLTFDTLREAEQARLKIESELSVSIVRDYASAAHTTLRMLMERYRDEVVRHHKGAAIETNRINRILRDEAFVDKKLAALSTEDLQDFITDRLTEVAPSTVDRDLDILSQVIRYADDVWKISAVESPFKGLRRPKYFNERDRRLKKHEEDALLAAAERDENPYVLPAIILALDTAMRRGELLALAGGDIDFEHRFALVRDSKNGRSRKVPLTQRAMKVLRHLVAENNERLLNLSANALKIAYFRRVLPASNVTDFHFHDCRHEAISRLAESGKFGLIELQAISGHRDMRMLQRYIHLMSGGLAEKMDDALEKTTKDYVHRGRKRRVVTVVNGDFVSHPVVEEQEAPVSITGGAKVIAFPRGHG